MLYRMYCMRDFKTGFLSPALELNEASAVRNFEHAVLRNDDSLFFSHPADYALFFVGDFDSDTGVLFPAKIPKEIVTADQVIQSALSKRGDRDGHK